MKLNPFLSNVALSCLIVVITSATNAQQSGTDRPASFTTVTSNCQQFLGGDTVSGDSLSADYSRSLADAIAREEASGASVTQALVNIGRECERVAQMKVAGK